MILVPAWCTPPGYRFVHNLPNKPLTGYQICKILKGNEMICKIFKTLELWFLWSFEEDTSLRLMNSISTLHLILSVDGQ
jgi:hypothetical protein